MMKTPVILKRIQAVLRAKMPPAAWAHEPLLWLWVADKMMMVDLDMVQGLPERPKMSKKLERFLLAHVGELLGPLSLNEGCRNYRKPWRNLSYCPKSPVGDYHWAWMAAHVVCAWRCERPFVEGFVALCQSWERDDHSDRDSNPYRDVVRHAEWDSGWLLGIEVQVQKKEMRAPLLMEWIKGHEAEINQKERP